MCAPWIAKRVRRSLGDTDAFQVSVFVVTLPHSGMVFAKCYAVERTPNWIAAHVDACNYFQGVLVLFVPDNASTALGILSTQSGAMPSPAAHPMKGDTTRVTRTSGQRHTNPQCRTPENRCPKGSAISHSAGGVFRKVNAANNLPCAGAGHST